MGKIAAIPIVMEEFPDGFTYILIKNGFEARALKTIRESMRTKGWGDDCYSVYEYGDKILDELRAEGIDAVHIVDIAIGAVTIPKV
jgi:hypothetical protein